MDQPSKRAILHKKLIDALARIVSKHGADLLPLLKQKSSALSRTALESDTAMQVIAKFCHGKLPFFLRILVREKRFVRFVLSHREFVLARLPVQNPSLGDGTRAK